MIWRSFRAKSEVSLFITSKTRLPASKLQLLLTESQMDKSRQGFLISSTNGKKRSIWFHLHFWIGWIAALPIALVCLSGGILIFEEAIFHWEHKELFQLEETGTPLSVQQVLDAYRSANPPLIVNHLGIPESPNHSYSAFTTELRPEGRRPARVFLNPYTGRFTRLNEEFSISETLISVHRRLAGGRTGQLIVGISSIVLIVTCIFGLVLWWPLRGRTFARAWQRGRALDWHNALGLVALLPLMLMALTGIAFTWGQSIWPLLEGIQGYPSQAVMPPVAVSERDTKVSMDVVVNRIRAELPNQRITGIQPGNGKQSPIKVFLDADGNNLQILVDPYTGKELLRFDGTGTGPIGWLRRNFGKFHTFGPFNIALRILWGLFSIGGTVLVVTGLWVSVKRYRLKQSVKQNSS